ncbi:tRNA glutamyl-Q(34) synthetase GluQRS [Lacisediminimonas sp.]|uniref:tRNA glutamyl-Q(34) synthetase GluQRS n=1 Tax=Lacisediminimonas sp. TaxID=3060582 RepID=UPI00271F3213|nr:tRNA glutamyl-Q(34) synthetase GluQRS [Lacisediminimonas sp.]MDO8298561.1 tRNA glutamyl-Q(34) synthetase GluQRS [Lacisediminimonas sp.]
MTYIGRFAPSPTGVLHAGSLVAALASFLDARVHGGRWLLRIEDVDEARTVPGSAQDIMQTLQLLGMQWDGEVVWQSQRKALYQQACERLGDHVFACACSRREIADSHTGLASDGAPIYPGTCRHGLPAGRAPRALRLRVPPTGDPAACIRFHDRWVGEVSQDLSTAVGDFVLRRADGYWSYQLAVVVDDAAQGVTHVVRGADLLDSTPRQIFLQQLLGLTTPSYLHVPAVTNARGEKLSKQTGAVAIDLGDTLQPLQRAAAFLGMATDEAASAAQFWRLAAQEWERRLRQREQGQ